MIKFNTASLLAGLEKALAVVNDVMPVAKTLGIVAPVVTIGISAISIIEHTLHQAKEAKIALSTQDETKLKAMLAELQAANDKLNGAIENS